MKVFVTSERKIYTLTFSRWEEGTSGFSGDGHWSGDWSDEFLCPCALPCVDGDVYAGTREDVDAMVDFLRESADASEEEWRVDVESEDVDDIDFEILCDR